MAAELRRSLRGHVEAEPRGHAGRDNPLPCPPKSRGLPDYQLTTFSYNILKKPELLLVAIYSPRQLPVKSLKKSERILLFQTIPLTERNCLYT
jgi:hypothetical protein